MREGPAVRYEASSSINADLRGNSGADNFDANDHSGIGSDAAGAGDLDIAVIGVAGSFPGAPDLDRFWTIVRAGQRTVRTAPAPESGVGAGDPASAAPTAVRAGGVLDGAELFDAAFFGYSPREAELLDPQQRVFLECAWTALEGAGYGSAVGRPVTGVYAGASLSTYLIRHLLPNPGLADLREEQMLGNITDTLATRAAYHLDLSGPAMSVQSACSTSLVAIHLACQALLAGDCEIAVAGGASVRLPQLSLHDGRENGILSPDGGCLPFDARSAGTVSGNGVGAVVLKPLAAALAAGDTVHAVVKATAVNNDGRRKVGFTAPSVQGQSAVLRAARDLAGVDPADIGYLEAHGTATPLGDPIEFAALAEAFAGRDPEVDGRCALGSVKALIGHLDAAAGVTGFLKVVLALKHAVVPPSPYFGEPNPGIDLAGSPFEVPTAERVWERPRGGRRLGAVSSFGMGGTNAHVILQEAPDPAPAGAPVRKRHLLTLSARTPSALETARERLREHLLTAPGPDAAAFADVASTLHLGRTAFTHRLALVADSVADAAAALAPGSPKAMTGHVGTGRRDIVFMFSGQGAQHVGMGAELHRTEPVYREAFDTCADLLVPTLGRDLRDLVLGDGAAEGLPGAAQGPAVAEPLRRTEFAQPALFAVEYALARLWESWGIRPTAMIGHSVGEYVAACLAGTMPLQDALRLVALRGRMMQALPPGRMLSVALPVEEAERFVGGDVAVAASNGPSLTVLSGPAEALDDIERTLAAEGVAVRALHTSHAFHSPAMDPVLEDFRALVAAVPLAAPALPFVSNLSGTWITAEEAASPDYWVRHLRRRVRFHEGLATLAENGPLALIEVGPGTALATLARQSPEMSGNLVVGSLPAPARPAPADGTMAEALARLWLAGTEPDWTGYWRHDPRGRAELPTYPFERGRYWIDPPASEALMGLNPAEGRPATDSAPLAAAGRDAADRDAAVNEDEDGGTAHDPTALTAYPRRLATPFVAPRDEREEAVAAVWSDLLGIAEIGVHDDFFELGGHSLLATRVVARLLDVLGVELPLSALMEAPTVAALCEYADDELMSAYLAGSSAAQPAATDPLSDPRKEGVR
ncbi:type I polyketide synthase [Streptomyces scabiei]|uniref:type I polyketide synthase n=1 Tax=Streptomyces scabiei TaxID=1930 RepID=UPI0029A78BDA|nr:beta-ketoacyl synthase N-terminal-like domain-containing protein [Streptomyces scabiei]MDX3112509.1 beta-ketoacyl synthase N-terminal-like domain-containing protein [Streptomyces scabiei]